MESSRQKRFHVEVDSDQRTPFERDHDRVIHSNALRRLAGVTQVVNPIEGHIFHNRLTHTLKVAQISRRIAQYLGQKDYDDKIILSLGGLSHEVAEAAALAHDLGHPPFGHIGEQVLDELVTQYNDSGFEGNAQSFRIVANLEVRRDSPQGLNLTKATLRAILKYPWSKSPDKHDGKKWGAYLTEAAELEYALDLLPTQRRHNKSLEAAIMDFADDVVYAIHDVEDFYKAHLIPLHALVNGARNRLAEGKNGDEELEWFTKRVLDRRSYYDSENVEKILTRLLTLFPITQRYKGTRPEQASLRRIFATLIGDYVTRVEVNKDAIESEENALNINPEILTEIKILKDLTRYYVHESHALNTQQHGQRTIIRGLFEIYFELSKLTYDGRSSTEYQMRQVLPVDFESLLEEEHNRIQKRNISISEESLRARVVADMISRMTDKEAITIYNRLTGVNLGSFFDYVS